MIELCATCEVCNLPKQVNLRIPFYQESKETPKAILIDDNFAGSGSYVEVFRNCIVLFGKVDFCYTSTSRCELGTATEEQKDRANQRCAVWTNLACVDRSVVVSTLKGLRQLGVEGDHKPGDVFTEEGLGFVVVIPPLSELTIEEMRSEWRPRVKRALREAALL